jgi:hypothetical protein
MSQKRVKMTHKEDCMNKIRLMALVITCVVVAIGCEGCDDTLTYYEHEVAFVSLAASFPNATINFSPTAALPAGVTYMVRDNRTPQNSWNSTSNGFNGQITCTTHYDGLVDIGITFTQTFYKNGTEVTGANSKRTVVVSVNTLQTTRFMSTVSDTGSVTLKLW